MSNALPQIALADTGRATTQLGFGCSGLMGGISERESLRLLETAYDAGIRHFDVAPSYGHGAAERCLGKFMRGKSQQVTITTKYGILPPRHTGMLEMARQFARPVVRLTAKRLPAIRQRVASAAAGLKGRANFSVAEARGSLNHSLRELGLERIDLWLLHEATAADMGDGALLEFLQEQVRLGRIGTFGIGSDAGSIPALWEQQRDYCRVLQFEWPGFAAALSSYPGAFLIHHRVLNENFFQLSAMLEQDKRLRQRWSEFVDLDLTDRKNLAALLVKAALFAHPDRIVLFSSRTPAHILANVGAAGDAGWNDRAERFREMILHRDIGQSDIHQPRNG